MLSHDDTSCHGNILTGFVMDTLFHLANSYKAISCPLAIQLQCEGGEGGGDSGMCNPLSQYTPTPSQHTHHPNTYSHHPSTHSHHPNTHSHHPSTHSHHPSRVKPSIVSGSCASHLQILLQPLIYVGLDMKVTFTIY